jgi:hypothetical protein
MAEELLWRNRDIFDDLSQKRRRDIPACMERDGCPSSISVSELAVRAALTNLNKAEPLQRSNHLPSL